MLPEKTHDLKSRACRTDFSFYETTAGIAIATVGLASQSQGAIVYSSGHSLVSTGDIAPFSTAVAGFEIDSQFSSSAYGFVRGIGNLELASGALAQFFRNGEAVVSGEADAFSGDELVFLPANGAQQSSDNYFAFRFTSPDVNGGEMVYGWAQVDHPELNMQSARLIAWAYENTGASIEIGAVPEPSGLALLALGAAGTAAFHRRRRERETAAAE